jgi:phosphomannomutase / phosphoglucomutase
MKINPYIFRGYDIRGVVDTDLNSAFAQALGKAFGTYLRRNGIKQAVVGRDARQSSPEYSKAAIEGLRWAGIDVFDIGMNLVGTFYWSQYRLNCNAGIYVSASHNPREYNGFKLAVDFSETMVSEGIQKMREMIENDDFEKGEKQGVLKSKKILKDYYKDILKRLPVKNKPKVLIDARFATAGAIVPDLLKAAGCKVIKINCNSDSSFPLGAPDPTEMHYAQELSQAVLKNKAAIGFSYDSDGDRIGIVDEKGGIIWNDVLVALFAKAVLADHPGATIMYNTLCSKVVADTILKEGGKPFMWRTGHSFLKKKNQEIKAAFIGELSGHFFFSTDFYNHDDGCYSALKLLSWLSFSGKTLSQAVSELPLYISSPEIKVFCADDKKINLMQAISDVLKKDLPDAQVIDDERAGDGVRLEMPDGMFIVRYSQNGPYLTVKFESKTKEGYASLKDYIRKLLQGYSEISWDSKINVNVEALIN